MNVTFSFLPAGERRREDALPQLLHPDQQQRRRRPSLPGRQQQLALLLRANDRGDQPKDRRRTPDDPGELVIWD